MNEVAARRLARIQQDKPKMVPLFQRVYDGKAPFLECIEAMCLDCIGLNQAEITSCTATACPLWHVRPYQNVESKKDVQ